MMATATATKKKAEQEPATFAEIASQRLTQQITAYRGYVARAAKGEKLSEEELEKVLEALDYLRLPQFAFERDTTAHREYESTAAVVAEMKRSSAAESEKARKLADRIKALEAELKAARHELYILTDAVDLRRVGHGQRLHELASLHPHLFLDLAEAVRLRQQARDTLAGTTRPEATRYPGEGWNR
jgi:hypothetical protein